MMRFKGNYDQFPRKEILLRDASPKQHSVMAYSWPTVDELEEILSPMTADAVLQVLKGEGIYRGYDAERHADNRIPVYGEYDRQIERKRVADTKRAKRARVDKIPLTPIKTVDTRYKEVSEQVQFERDLRFDKSRLRKLEARLAKVNHRLMRRQKAYIQHLDLKEKQERDKLTPAESHAVRKMVRYGVLDRDEVIRLIRN